MTARLLIILVTCFTDSLLFNAYLREDMTVWKEYIDSAAVHPSPGADHTLLYEYGLCGYMVEREKEQALPYLERFKNQVASCQQQMPEGHYEMYRSAVYVYEMSLHRSFHPLKAMNLAKEATRMAPEDPLVLAHYATCLFYAPPPFGNKREALKVFEQAKARFNEDDWQYCWVRQATENYIIQCRRILKMH